MYNRTEKGFVRVRALGRKEKSRAEDTLAY